MSEAPEIPEAEDPFAKRIALTIAILAVIMSFIGNHGDNAKTDAIIKTNEATDTWAHFQSKSLKGHAYQIAIDELETLTPGDPAKRDALVLKYRQKIADYETEKSKLQSDAEALVAEARHGSAINDRTDLASLLLQIGVILCSVAILVKHRGFWFAGMGVGAAGAVIGATAFLL